MENLFISLECALFFASGSPGCSARSLNAHLMGCSNFKISQKIARNFGQFILINWIHTIILWFLFLFLFLICFFNSLMKWEELQHFFNDSEQLRTGVDSDYVTYGLWRTNILTNCSKSFKNRGSSCLSSNLTYKKIILSAFGERRLKFVVKQYFIVHSNPLYWWIFLIELFINIFHILCILKQKNCIK